MITKPLRQRLSRGANIDFFGLVASNRKLGAIELMGGLVFVGYRWLYNVWFLFFK